MKRSTLHRIQRILITAGYPTLAAKLIVKPKDWDADTFFGKWFMSRKEAIPKSWYLYLASKYPYRGTAFRQSDSTFGAPYTSWCKTMKGMSNWVKHIRTGQTLLEQATTGYMVFQGTITKGVDLARFCKEDKDLSDPVSSKLIMDIEEVFPLLPVSGIKRVL